MTSIFFLHTSTDKKLSNNAKLFPLKLPIILLLLSSFALNFTACGGSNISVNKKHFNNTIIITSHNDVNQSLMQRLQEENDERKQQRRNLALPLFSDPRSVFNKKNNNKDKKPIADNGNKLEFIHITKTGGSAIEIIASKQGNIIWGACHYRDFPHIKCPSHAPDWVSSPEQRIERQYDRMPKGYTCRGEPWHTPPHWLKPNPMYQKDTFVVVRDPYDRLISEYYCSSFGYKGDNNPNNPEIFNYWLKTKLLLIIEKKLYQGHMLPQHYYVYDEYNNQIVTHILRYENNLQQSFEALMDQYGLPLRLPPKGTSSTTFYNRKYSSAMNDESNRRITPNDISSENIKMIYEVYQRDFQLFNYPIR